MKEGVTIFNEKAEALFTQEPVFELLAEGFSFAEGPVWDMENDCLYFTDFPEDKIYRWHKEQGLELYRDQANRPIGLALDQNGNIISTESSQHRIAQIDKCNSISLATEYQGQRFNSPNDVIVAKDGAIWFTDPYSQALGLASELQMNGVYRMGSDGEVGLVWGGFNRPNGLALSLDEGILYVNDTDLQQIFALKIESGQVVGEPRVLATLDTSFGEGAPDGMKIDEKGNIWVTGPGGIWVLSSAGEALGLLRSPKYVGNFCFGEKERNVLYITASNDLYRVLVDVSGI
jgi:Gluconolactonase